MLSPVNFTIKEILFSGAGILKSRQIENPRLESEILLGHLLGMNKTQLILHDNKIISENIVVDFEELLNRKSTGEPTAYILGYKEFYGRNFEVSPSVLIPRPETEELVEWIIRSHNKIGSLLDLCCGSGCIGITIGLESEVSRLILSDKSMKALHVAENNLNHLARGLKVELCQSDLFQDLNLRDLDLIVSNPPYVTSDEYDHLELSVKDFEPKEALLLDSPGVFNKKIIEGAHNALRIGGGIYMETNPSFTISLKHFLENYGFEKIQIKKDLSGKDRFIRGFKS